MQVWGMHALIIIAIAVMLCSILGFFLITGHLHDLKAERIPESWNIAADVLGGDFDGDQVLDGLLRHRGRLSARIDGRSVVATQRIEIESQPTRHGAYHGVDVDVVELRAEIDSPGLLSIDIDPMYITTEAHTETPEGKWGVQTSEWQLADAILTTRTREAIRRAEGYHLKARGQEIVTRRKGLENDPDRLVRAMRATAVLANAGRVLHRRLSSVADSLDAVVEGSGDVFHLGRTRVVFERDEAKILVDFERATRNGPGGPNGFVTLLSSQLTHSARDRFALYRDEPPPGFEDLEVVEDFHKGLSEEFWIVAEDVGRTRRRLSRETCDAFLALEPLSVTLDGERVTLRLDGFELSERWLLEATDVVAALCEPLDAEPYR